MPKFSAVKPRINPAIATTRGAVNPWQRDELPTFGGTNLLGDANLLLEGPRSGRRDCGRWFGLFERAAVHANAFLVSILSFS